MKRTGEKGKMVGLTLSRAEACPQVQREQREKAGLKIDGGLPGQTDRSSEIYTKLHLQGRSPNVGGGILETLFLFNHFIMIDM